MHAFQEQQQNGEDRFLSSVVLQMLASGSHPRKWEGEASLGLNPVLDQRVEVVCWRSSPTLKFRSQTYTCKKQLRETIYLTASGAVWLPIAGRKRDTLTRATWLTRSFRIGTGRAPF